MILDPKLLAEALQNGGVPAGATLLTAGSKEELLAKLADVLGEQEEENEERERLTGVALSMTPEKASNLAAAALLGAGQEFERGHQDCARLKIDAAGIWVELADTLLNIESRREHQARQAEEQERINQMMAPLREQAEADAAKIREQAAEPAE